MEKEQELGNKLHNDLNEMEKYFLFRTCHFVLLLDTYEIFFKAPKMLLP